MVSLELLNSNAKIEILNEILTDLAFETKENLPSIDIQKKDIIMQLLSKELKRLKNSDIPKPPPPPAPPEAPKIRFY